MTFLYGINFGVAILLTMLLAKRTSTKADIARGGAHLWLLIYMSSSAAIFLLLAISTLTDVLALPLKIFAGGSGFILLPAFFYTYLLSLQGKSTRWVGLFVIPFFLHFGWQLVDSVDSKEYSFYYGLTVVAIKHPIEYWVGSLIFLSQTAFPIVGLHQIHKHQSDILDRYSDFSGIDLLWIQRLLWSILIALLFATLLMIPWSGRTLISIQWSLPILFTLISAQQIYIAHFGLIQGAVFLPRTQIQDSPSNKIEVFATIGQNKVQQLTSLMEKQELFKQPRLTIEDLARQIDWPLDELSTVINKGLNKNFFEFVNTYRVNAVKNTINEASIGHATLLDIGYHCGFNSKTAFNSTFKKLTGLTPTAYKVKCQPSQT